MFSTEIDLRRSLRSVFADRPGASEQIERDAERQEQTAREILRRFFSGAPDRREMILLADEVGLGKTFVALAVAVSMLDAIRRSEAPIELPTQKPVALVLTPNSAALHNKWLREAETFKRDCRRSDDALEWLTITAPLEESQRSGNVIDLAKAARTATRSGPLLMIARLRTLGAALHGADEWRKRALAAVFQHFGIGSEARPRLCRWAIETGSWAKVPELLDLRQAVTLWENTGEWAADLRLAYDLTLRENEIATKLREAIDRQDGDRFRSRLDDLTRLALVRDLARFPLVIVDEIHKLKNEDTAVRRNVETILAGKVVRFLGLSATPFQLHHEELLSVLGLRRLLAIGRDRHEELDAAVESLRTAMNKARDAGARFRETWRGVPGEDRKRVHETWAALEARPRDEWRQAAEQVRPSRISRALIDSAELERVNRRLEGRLRPFVIRHRHERGYRRHLIGRNASLDGVRGTPHFEWAPGMEVAQTSELVHYILMRAVALAKRERGRAGLSAELTGSYRHLFETAAVWRRLGEARDPRLSVYRDVLKAEIGDRASDRKHPKIQATVERALEAFRRGQKTLIFCVFVKTAEALRDELDRRVDEELGKKRDEIFGGADRFELFRARFFNRREPLFALIQDHPLLGLLSDGSIGVPEALRLGEAQLGHLGEMLVGEGEGVDVEKPDRRLLLAAVEHLAVRTWEDTAIGRSWLDQVFAAAPELRRAIGQQSWVPGRAVLATAPRLTDPQARSHAADPLGIEESRGERRAADGSTRAGSHWLDRLRASARRGESLVHAIAPYFRSEAIGVDPSDVVPPLLAAHHAETLAKLDVETRRAAGQVFRRVLMAEEYLLRYLADIPPEGEQWIEYLSRHYTARREGHQEALRGRVHAYLETLARAAANERLLSDYREAATNLNVVQLVRGGMAADRYFLGFNTPYRPEILVATSVGQEGIDLHRECRHVIHHDLCWNPAVIEQRTGRVDRIGSKVERERAEATEGAGPTLDVAVPYLAATYDERMFEELYHRAQMFEVTMGGDFLVDGRIDAANEDQEVARREREGIGTEDEDLGHGGEELVVDLPLGMVERLRVDLAVWKA
jgi:hypothetical protein